MQSSHKNRLASKWPKSMHAAAKERDEDSWSETAKGWERNLEQCMGDYPKLTLAAAATLGFVVGWMVKRK